MSRAALFLDRDGTIIRHVHYLRDPAQVELLPGVQEALRRAREMRYMLFLHTNQSGVGRGMFPIEDAVACNVRMINLLGMGPDVFTDVCIAPEAPWEPVAYRKPSPRFAREMAAKHGLNLARCFMVGDYSADIETAFAAGMQPAALEGGNIRADDLAVWRKAGRDVILHPSLAAFVQTLA